MKRRGFLQSIAALGLQPRLPLAFAAPAAPAAANASGAYNSFMFGHALSIVRTKGELSVAELQSITKLTQAQCQRLVADMALRGFVSQSVSAQGALQAIKPSWQHWQHAKLPPIARTLPDAVSKLDHDASKAADLLREPINSDLESEAKPDIEPSNGVSDDGTISQYECDDQGGARSGERSSTRLS